MESKGPGVPQPEVQKPMESVKKTETVPAVSRFEKIRTRVDSYASGLKQAFAKITEKVQGINFGADKQEMEELTQDLTSLDKRTVHALEIQSEEGQTAQMKDNTDKDKLEPPTEEKKMVQDSLKVELTAEEKAVLETSKNCLYSLLDLSNHEKSPEDTEKKLIALMDSHRNLLNKSFLTSEYRNIIPTILSTEKIQDSTLKDRAGEIILENLPHFESVFTNQDNNSDIEAETYTAVFSLEEIIKYRKGTNIEAASKLLGDYFGSSIKKYGNEEYFPRDLYKDAAISILKYGIFEDKIKILGQLEDLQKEPDEIVRNSAGEITYSLLEEVVKDKETVNEPSYTQKAFTDRLVKQSMIHFSEKYSCPTEDITTAWKNGGKEKELSDRTIYNIDTMKQVELERPGICQTLYKEFGIRNFGRYPAEMLIKQYDQRNDTDKRYGAILLPLYDHNGAYYQDRSRYHLLSEQLDAINSNLPAGEAPFAIRAYEVGSKMSVARALVSANRRYGEQHKISFAIIGGHGTSNSIELGKSRTLNAEEKNNIMSNDLEGHGVQRIPEFFEPDPTIILSSCSTGELGGIGEKISNMGATVKAPDKPTSIKDINVTYIEGNLSFDVTYNDENVAQTYMNGSTASKSV